MTYTAEFKNAYASEQAKHVYSEAEERFDAWLDGVTRAAKCEAWDDAISEAWSCGLLEELGAEQMHERNPYLAGAE